MLIVDAHLDLAWNIARGRDITQPAAEQPFVQNETATTGLPDLRAAGVGLVAATIFCRPDVGDGNGYTDHAGALAQAHDQLASYRRLFDSGHLRAVSGRNDLPDPAAAPSTPSAVLLMEGADAITLAEESTGASAEAWFNAGVRMVGLAWGATRYAGGTGAPGPLTETGRRLVPELDATGMIHDASHLADESLDGLLDLAQRPICASHSNARALVKDDPRGRHLTDDYIRRLIGRGGVIGINLFDKFLLPPDVLETRRADLADVVAHIRQVCDLAGDARHVGIGTDLDGGFGRERIPKEMTTAADLPMIADALAATGFSDADIRAIMGGNWLRFFSDALPAATH